MPLKLFFIQDCRETILGFSIHVSYEVPWVAGVGYMIFPWVDLRNYYTSHSACWRREWSHWWTGTAWPILLLFKTQAILAQSTEIQDVRAVVRVFRCTTSILRIGADGFSQEVPDTFGPASVWSVGAQPAKCKAQTSESRFGSADFS